MHLAALLPDLALPPEAAALPVTDLAVDSRLVHPGAVFFALAGSCQDGRRFAADAVVAGAVAVVARGDLGGLPVPVIDVAEPRLVLARAAARFWPTQPATVVAVTGTNGKTSVANFTRQLWAALGYRSAALGTVGVVTDQGTEPLGHTTPEPTEIHRLLQRLAAAGIGHAALEASSHGLAQFRLDGVRLAAAAFTNLTRDHLDYHGDAAAYRRAKERLFAEILPEGAPAVINVAGDGGEGMAAVARQRGLRLITVGGRGADLALVGRRPSGPTQALRLEIFGERDEVVLPLAGDFQAANALVALGLALATGAAPGAAVAAMADLRGVPGRMELVGHHPSGAPVYVDYAHTPDALARVLAALRPHAEGRLVVVFGAGGDRDPGKRTAMGQAAGARADRIIVTDDNPRSEEPAAIRKAVLAGCRGALEIGDRAAAIAAALSELAAGDLVVVAGKGHEQGQIVKGVVRPFDDRAVVRSILAALTGDRR